MRILGIAGRAGLAIALVAAPAVAPAHPEVVGQAASSAAASPIVVVPGTERYTQAPPPFSTGTMVAVLSGDPAVPAAPYTIRYKFPDGTRIPVHTHGGIENVTVVRGSFLVAIGPAFDTSKLHALPPGSYVSIPPGLAHYAMASGETVVDVSGVGPESTALVK
jgi:quercetin dioxygenase-like cupin family protein